MDGPQVFLSDEPLSNLDATPRMEIGRLHRPLATTMIYVTHDLVEAMTLADRIVVLKDGQVMQIGAPMDPDHDPANLFVPGFLGAPSMNFVKVTVQGVNGGKALVSNAALDPVEVSARRGPFKVGDQAILGLRPQYLSVAQRAGRRHGSVALTERLGAETVVEVTLKDGNPLIAALSHEAAFDLGAQMNLDFDPDQAHLFPEDGSTTGSRH